MRKPRLLAGASLLIGILFVYCFFHLGTFLAVENFQPSDAIVVLAGDVNDKRYDRGIELLRRGYGQQMFLDASEDFIIYGHTYAYWAQQFIAEASPDVRTRVRVCPIREDSTLTEIKYVAKCLSPLPAGSRILLVSSDYHTRRALSIFAARLPSYRWSVAAATDSTQFGMRWWQHRQWAKTAVKEWQKLLWWEFVERWV